MIKNALLLLKASILLLFLTSCSSKNNAFSSNYEGKFRQDSIQLNQYELHILKSQFDESDSLVQTDIDSLFYYSGLRFPDKKVVYTPNKAFKIYTIESESCGAYCNSEWFSWIHFKYNNKEHKKEIAIASVDTIYSLPDEKYLIIASSGYRPASVYTIHCQNALLISFDKDSVIEHSIVYKKEKTFQYCQENGVDMEGKSFITYDSNRKELNYHFGNNYAYSHNKDIDTLRTGKFQYKDGNFIFKNEVIKININ